MASGYSIELKNNFDWSEDSVLSFTTHACSVILFGKSNDQEQSFLVLEFQRALTARSASTDCDPSIGIASTPGKSCVSIITDSNWDNEAHTSYRYTGTPKTTDRKHFIVSCHDVFHEILAESFTEKKITKNTADYDAVKSAYTLSGASVIKQTLN